MSLLPATSHANPTTPFWATAGGGGGGGVTSINAGAGIFVDNTTGDVIVTNTIPAVDVSLGDLTTGSNSIGIDDDATWNVGTFKEENFYANRDHYYTAGVTFNIYDINSASGSYDGNIWVTLEYNNGISAVQGRQTINISHQFDNYYSASVVIGFFHIAGGVLNLDITNKEGHKINSFNYAITNFYCVDHGIMGSTNPLFTLP